MVMSADATKSLTYGYKPIQDSLAQIYDEVEQKSIEKRCIRNVWNSG